MPARSPTIGVQPDVRIGAPRNAEGEEGRSGDGSDHRECGAANTGNEGQRKPS